MDAGDDDEDGGAMLQSETDDDDEDAFASAARGRGSEGDAALFLRVQRAARAVEAALDALEAEGGGKPAPAEIMDTRA